MHVCCDINQPVTARLSYASDRQPLVRAPGLVALGARVAGLLDGGVDELAALRGPGARGDFPLPFLVREPVTELELHGQRAARGRLGLTTRCRRRFPPRSHLVFGPRGSTVSGRQSARLDARTPAFFALSGFGPQLVSRSRRP